MAIGACNLVVQDANGRVVSGAQVTVYRESDGGLASIYSDIGGTPTTNPLVTGADGTILFFAEADPYKITAVKGSALRTWRYVAIGAGSGYDPDHLVMNTNSRIGWADDAVTLDHSTGKLSMLGALLAVSFAGLAGSFTNTSDAASVEAMRLVGARATPTVADRVYQSFYLNNNAGASTEFARVTGYAAATTASAETSQLRFSLRNAGGSLTERLGLGYSNLFPVTNDTVALGTSSLGFSDLFLASGGIINWNNGDVTITHSSGALSLVGALSSVNSAAPLDSDAQYYFADYDCKAANIIRLNWSSSMTGISGGGFRDALFIDVRDSDTNDYTSIGQKVTYGIRSYVASTDPTAAQYKDFTAGTFEAIGRTEWADRGMSGVTASAIQYGSGIASNEFYAGNPASASSQSLSMAALQAIISSKKGSNDGSHKSRGVLVSNLGKRVTAAFSALSGGTDGDPGTFQYGLDFSPATIDSAGAAIKFGPSSSGNAGTTMEYDTNDYTYYDRAANFWASVIGGTEVLRLGAANAGFGDVGATWGSTVAGRGYVSVVGASGAGLFRVGSRQAEAEFINVGGYEFHDFANGKRVGYIVATLRGGTAGDRGAGMGFGVKQNGSASSFESIFIDQLGSVVLGAQAALNTNATDGFLYIPTCAGAPTGTPTAWTGHVALVADTTNNRLYMYSGGSWRLIGP